MWIELAAGGYLLGRFIYHRLTQEPPKEEDDKIETTAEEGGPIPMLFGETRIRRPVMAWNGPLFWAEADNVRTFQMNVFYVLASGFEQGESLLRAAYYGDQLVEEPGAVKLAHLTGDGGFETPAEIQYELDNPSNDNVTGGLVEFLNGNPDQVLISDAGSTTTYSGNRMLANLTDEEIPGYRNVLSVLLFDSPNAFQHGTIANPSAWNFVASSLRDHPALISGRHFVGRDANPANVIYEVLTSALGKLGLPTSMIDTTSFRDAQSKLYTETLGYSRCFTERMSAADIINDVLRQIDGVLFMDPTTNTIKLKLIRGDYDPNTIFQINRQNCRRLTGFAMGGRTNLVNKVTIRFPNRQKNYDMDTVTAQDLANAVGQDGQVAEEVLEYMGCVEPAVAANLAGRELAARCMPVVKLRAEGVSRSALRLNPGDAVRLTWTNPDIAGSIFRVMNVQRGTHEDGAIALDLISDVFYVWRSLPPQVPTLPPNQPTTTLGG